MHTFPFSKKDLASGTALLEAGKVGQLLFSEGTYQVEVGELKKKEKFWPFLQLDDAGKVIDFFCNCPEAEKEGSCKHLGAAYQKIFRQAQPLHVRFRESLWNHLCILSSRRHGYDPSVLKGSHQKYEAVSVTGKLLFSVEGKNPVGKKRLQELLFKRLVETEETSLKFSNLPPEEIALWRVGRPSQQLQYELSFWSDLAKWMMALQEEGEPYKVQFKTEEMRKEGDRPQLPSWAEITFSQLSICFYIAEANWPQLVGPLSTIQSPLPIHESQHYKIEKIAYDVDRKIFVIERKQMQGAPSKEPEVDLSHALDVGEWKYLPEKGFFPKKVDQLLKQDEIPSDRIASALQKHLHIFQKFLSNAKIHLGGVKAQYKIHFDAEKNLDIHCFLFEENDLQQEKSAYFGPWVYIHEKGFYRVENLLFDGIQKSIPRQKMNDFINRHRVWLGGFEGFQTHVYAIESQLHFDVNKEGFLKFEASIELGGTGEEVVDFGEWVYLSGKGFFAKRIGRGGSLIRPGTIIHKSEISSFIRAYRDDLEPLRGFFASRTPLDKSGVEIFLSDAHRIVVRPHFQFFPPYDASVVQIFGDYTYVAGEGFYEIPFEKRVPEDYVREKTIPLADEPNFVFFELEALKPFTVSIQNELKRPKEFYFKIHRLQKSGRTKAAEWLLEGVFETEIGSIEPIEVWRAVQENRRYLFSSAGLLHLRQPRFNWLKTIPKKRWLKEGKQLRLTTLEWLRLSLIEDLRAPQGDSVEEERSREWIESLSSFHADQPIDLSGFKSDLRAYQEMGVKWLWFLYTYGLSGMLCDEMGLGKTHQAMGLMAAFLNQKKEGKILVVCPTSVIYHWEELLKKFLPKIRVLVFYGTHRKLEPFAADADLLLTSYGTLRSEKDLLSKMEFELAIYDELQIAKNPYSQTHKALKKMKAAMRVGLTGTPIENRLLELKALFDVIIPGYFPNEAQFKETFVNPIEKAQDPEKKTLLAKLIKPFILRRKKTEVLLELPEKIEEISYCDLSDEQRDLYAKTFLMHKEALVKDLEDAKKPVPYLHVFSLLTTLKQICDHPCMITKEFSEFQKHRSGKWDLFVELLQEIRDSGQKVVIFSQYLDMLDMIEAYLKEQKIGYCGIRGSTRNRKEQLEKFRDDPQSEVFLASLQAVGVGVDLVSASVVIHYDRWWNPARENQATDRVHRIGQNRGVQVFKLVTKGTIEEHIHRLIEKKLSLTEGVLGFDDQDQVKGLDRDELLRLLNLIDKDVQS